jgi:PiT family inorganic phosphate transporter
MTLHKPRRTTLDKDLDKFTYVEEATAFLSRSRIALGVGALFLVATTAAGAVFFSGHPHVLMLTLALAIGGYMALNIGANDVSNNMGPAVGARAMTMGGALLLAAVCEAAGALLVGSNVVATISSRLLDVSAFSSPPAFALAMMSALVAAAVWINVATLIGAPVSTTHAVVGGVVGAGIGAAGTVAVETGTLVAIAFSWLVTPVIGGICAALLLAAIKTGISEREDKIGAARCWLPVLFGVMSGTFVLYLLTVAPPAKLDLSSSASAGLAALAALCGGGLSVPLVRASARGLENRNQSLRQLFRVPLIAAAAILSFAHGANDVANAVGPVAAIFTALQFAPSALPGGSGLPVLAIAAVGISFGIMLFGPRLVRMVGERITRLNPIRGFCVVLATASVVLVASALGLPVSSTHIAVGAVFGVGFFREWSTNRARVRSVIGMEPEANVGFRRRWRREAADMRRRRLVRRAHVLTIVTAWMVTVPASALLAAVIHYLLA